MFEDDFSRRTQGLWNEAYGDWSIENGHYVIRGEGLSQLQLDVAGIESLRDVTVELSVIGAIPGTGIWLRALPVPDAESYHAGDTWYRDMRVPGFEGRQAPNPDNSLQWLARQIVSR